MNVGEYIGNYYKGWFVPPETASYKFYMACDNYCLLKFGETAGRIDDLTVLLDIKQWTGLRDYWKEDGVTRVSKVLNLQKGQHYYIETSHVEYTGGDHVSVGV